MKKKLLHNGDFFLLLYSERLIFHSFPPLFVHACVSAYVCVYIYACVHSAKALRASAECFNPPFGVLNMNVIECPS